MSGRDTIFRRLVRGTRRAWRAERLEDQLPADLDLTVMDLPGGDRHHRKQGRSTCRVRLDLPGGPLSVYLKRHDRLPWRDRLLATIDPRGGHSPGIAEWGHLRAARDLGIPVPEAVAAGERIGPWGRLQSYLLVADLVGCDELNRVLPEWASTLDPARFAREKRAIVAELAGLVATLHAARMFHKDLYLCHIFVNPGLDAPPGRRLTLIDLHRLGRHRWTAPRWRWKDLGQLLFSTFGVPGVDDRDRLRFWSIYRRRMRLRHPRLERDRVLAKAARYARHNRGGPA